MEHPCGFGRFFIEPLGRLIRMRPKIGPSIAGRRRDSAHPNDTQNPVLFVGERSLGLVANSPSSSGKILVRNI
jgi:hypothetical protein